MKRFYSFVLVAASLLGATGCQALEKDVIVQYAVPTEVEGVEDLKYLDYEDRVNIFNNALLPEKAEVQAAGLKTLPGQTFLGWSTTAEYNAEDPNPAPLFQGIVHYKDVESYAKDGKVTLYAVAGVKNFVHHDFVVAWYNKPTTSGCTPATVAKMTEGITNFVKSVNPAYTDVVFKGYEGNVGGSCAAIEEDVMAGTLLPNIMLGWKANVVFSAQSDLEYATVKNADGASIATTVGEEGSTVKTDRYIITLSYAKAPISELTQKVVDWLLTPEGAACMHVGA